MPGEEEAKAKAEEKAKVCSLEILMKSGKWTRYQHKDYETAVAEAERIAAAIRERNRFRGARLVVLPQLALTKEVSDEGRTTSFKVFALL